MNKKKTTQTSPMFSKFEYLFDEKELDVLYHGKIDDKIAIVQKKKFLSRSMLSSFINNVTVLDSFYSYSEKQLKLNCFRSFPTFETCADFLIQPLIFASAAVQNHVLKTETPIDAYLFCFVNFGQAELEYKNHSYPLTKGSAFLIDLKIGFSLRTVSNAPFDYSCIYFSGQNSGNYYSVIEQSGEFKFDFEPNSRLQKYLSELLSLPYDGENQEYVINFLIVGILTEMVMLAKNIDSNTVPFYVSETISFINLHYGEKITLDTLSDKVGISKFHLSREFKRYKGLTINDYLTSVRMDKARVLLLTTDLSISSISGLVGYFSQNRFTEQFHKTELKTPLRFRKDYRLKQ